MSTGYFRLVEYPGGVYTRICRRVPSAFEWYWIAVTSPWGMLSRMALNPAGGSGAAGWAKQIRKAKTAVT